MDKHEALGLLNQRLSVLEQLPYSELVKRVRTNEAIQVIGQSGTEYNVEITVVWNGMRENEEIRVIGSIDDGHFWSAFRPGMAGFVMSPSGLVTSRRRGEKDEDTDDRKA